MHALHTLERTPTPLPQSSAAWQYAKTVATSRASRMQMAESVSKGAVEHDLLLSQAIFASHANYRIAASTWLMHTPPRGFEL